MRLRRSQAPLALLSLNTPGRPRCALSMSPESDGLLVCAAVYMQARKDCERGQIPPCPRSLDSAWCYLVDTHLPNAFDLSSFVPYFSANACVSAFCSDWHAAEAFSSFCD
jgi:hypothetical protein